MALTQSADYFTGLRDDITMLALDVARSRFIDVERLDDDRNFPDEADLRNAQRGGDPTQPAIAGMTIGGWLLVGTAVVVGVILLKKVL